MFTPPRLGVSVLRHQSRRVKEFADRAQFDFQLVLVGFVQRGELFQLYKYMPVLAFYKMHMCQGASLFCRTSMMKNSGNTKTF